MKSRRDFIAGGAAARTLVAAGQPTEAAASARDSMRAGRSDVGASVNALVCDVFGTVVDWRGSIARPFVFGPKCKADTEQDGPGVADVIASDFMDLAAQLGV